MDVSDIFYFFSARGRERGSPRRRPGRGGGNFLWKIPGGGGAFPGSGSGRGGKGPGGCLLGIGRGGGVNIFFRGRNVHRVIVENKPENGHFTLVLQGMSRCYVKNI